MVQRSLRTTTSLGSSHTTRKEHFAFLWHLPLPRQSSPVWQARIHSPRHAAVNVCCRLQHSWQFCLPVSVLGLLVSSHAFNCFIIILPHFLFVACYFSAVAAIFPFFPVLTVPQSSCPSQLLWILLSPKFHPFCCCRDITHSFILPLQEITIILAVLHTMAIGGH